MTGRKVVGIEEGKKPEPACKFCGQVPACPDWTCLRLQSVTVDEVGWTVEFVPVVYLRFTPDEEEPE